MPSSAASVRAALGLAALALTGLVAGACATAIAPISEPAPARATPATRLFLIGDSGGAARNPVLLALQRELARDPEHSTVLVLGDLVYPNGLPAPTTRAYAEAERRLRGQLDAVRVSGARGVFVPGNHDWGVQGDGEPVRRLGEYIASYGSPRVSMLPADGCPGPAVLDVDSLLRVIVLDTEWWLRAPAERSRAGPGADACPATEADAMRTLRAALASAGERRVVVAAHHPLASVGLHGGRLGWRDQIFPLRDAWEPLWIPLPVVGTAYQLARAAAVAPQDLASSDYARLRRSLNEALATHPPLIYAAGHDHNLQVLRGRTASYVLVSGAGSYGNAGQVVSGSDALFARAGSGFMRLELRGREPPRLTVLEVDASGTARTSFSTTLDERPHDAGRVLVTPNDGYRAGWAHRALLGANYRELWATPITVDVLDLRAEAGGLHPTERGGSQQTHSLRFAGANGREYVFRSLDKDPSPGLPPELRETIVLDLFRDQTSAYHPGAALVVARLLDATGIRHAQPRLVVLPNDSLLGAFRSDFAGQLGTFEERPGKGFDEGPGAAGATDVVSSDKLFERMAKSPEVRVDTRAYLAARLFDNFVGDRDRHRDQWRWARFGGDDALWEPVPRDRDMAFVRQEGLLLSLTRQWYPQLSGFGDRYTSPHGINWNGREIDRRLLASLERPVWDSVARALQAALTDAVIDDAVGAMPAPFVIRNAGELRASLRARRDELPRMAERFYALLAGDVDVRGTDRRDLAEVTRGADGSVEIALSAEGASPGAPYFHRRFVPSETHEVRIYLGGADDRAVLRGDGVRGIGVRIIGGTGDDRVIDSAASGPTTRVYDEAGDDSVAGANVSMDRRAYSPPPTRRAMDPNRDWGHDWRPANWISSAPDIGLFVGVGRTLYRYGFREHPYSSRSTLRAGYALQAGKARAQFDGEYHRMNGRGFASLFARASGIEIIRFYGIGNGTIADQPRDFYRVQQTQLQLEPGLVVPLSDRTALTLGAVAKYVATEERAATLVGTTAPYGAEAFGQLGVRAGAVWDTRDDRVATRHGVRLHAGGAVFPAVLGLENTYAESYATAAAFLSPQSQRAPTLAVRGGARHLWGTFPFYEAALIGGEATLRGWDEQRFAGRTALYGNVELRQRLGRVVVIVPTEIGGFALADVGRVAPAAGSDAWHTGVGGGLWIAPFKRSNTISLAYARGTERSAFYTRMGFLF